MFKSKSPFTVRREGNGNGEDEDEEERQGSLEEEKGKVRSGTGSRCMEDIY